MSERRALHQIPPEPDRIGFYGKLPTHGDFVSTGMGRGLQDALDAWLQAGLQAAQREFGDDWERRFKAMPAWRFVIERGLWGPSTVAGVMVASTDRVGRSFPLVVAALLHGYRDHPTRLCRDDTWFMAAEAIAETSARRDFDVAHFTASLKRLRGLRPSDLEDEGFIQPNPSSRGVLWWRIDPEDRQTRGFRTSGPPHADHLPKLLRESSPPPAAAAAAPPTPPQRPPMAVPPEPLRHPVLRHGFASHPGTRLTLNADAVLSLDKPSLFVVGDGIGDGTSAAEAARIAVHVLGETAPQTSIDALVQEVKGKLGRAHGLLQSAGLSAGREPPCASIVALTACEGQFALLWAGDARCYLIRDGTMRCLTRDHVKVGLKRSLSNALGMAGQLRPEVFSDNLHAEDRFLLCGGSLPRILPERSIAEILVETDVDSAAAVLVQEGLIANCRENLSAIVIDVAAGAT